MKDLLPPVEVSRTLLAVLVAVGALLSIVTTGQVSHFAAGFAAGAGAAFVVSRFRRPREDADAREAGERG